MPNPMSDVERAAERFAKRGYSGPNLQYGLPGDCYSDMLTLAEAWLAENDPTPIDWAYAEEQVANSEFGLAQRDGKLFVVISDCDILISTRGGLRQLAKALGIPLEG